MCEVEIYISRRQSRQGDNSAETSNTKMYQTKGKIKIERK